MEFRPPGREPEQPADPRPVGPSDPRASADQDEETALVTGGLPGGQAEEPEVVPVSAAKRQPPPTSGSDLEQAAVRAGRGRHARSHRRGKPRRLLLVVLVVTVVLVAAGVTVGVRLRQAGSLASVQPSIPSVRAVPGTDPRISWPAQMASAFAIPSLGISDESGREVAEPIASVTKLMTAHLVLDDHPLKPGEAGPLITVSQDDVNLYLDDQTSDQSSVEVRAGEVLSEYQLLEGMLVGSANNFANMLAVFDAGSVSSFVAKMNAEAARLHMTRTHYADASGYMKTSVSTAASQLKVAAQDVTNPVFDQIVDSSSVILPLAGTVPSKTPFIGTDGVVGVKSGFTVVAGGCDVLALRGDVGGVGVEVLAAVTGDHVDGNPIEGAGLKALSVAQAAMSRVRVLHPVQRGERVGVAKIAASSVPVVSRSEVTVVGWPGQRVRESFDLLARPHTGSSAGFVVGRVTVRVGRQESRVTVLTSHRLPTPTFWERVF